MKIKNFIIFIIIGLILIYFLKKNNVLENFVNEKKYVYWTGGYDSTFRLCYLLVVKKKIVQPIYLRYNLDNDDVNKYWVRKNRIQELEAMEKVRELLFKKYPYTRNLLKKTIVVSNDLPDEEYTKEFNNLNLFPTKRKVHQYEHLFRYAYKNKVPIDLGVIGLHTKKQFIIYLHKHLKKIDDSFYLPNEEILSYCRFPLFGLPKPKMFEIAKDHDFDDILSLSWSCWFPKSDGTPCGKCPMCRERYIPHPK